MSEAGPNPEGHVRLVVAEGARTASRTSAGVAGAPFSTSVPSLETATLSGSSWLGEAALAAPGRSTRIP